MCLSVFKIRKSTFYQKVFRWSTKFQVSSPNKDDRNFDLNEDLDILGHNEKIDMLGHMKNVKGGT